ncbi:hypothetical protein RJ639_033366 [Escallonia herrerae]|uniref:Uncharacterized protein n=1 Tax=Escallonia herrerae TaxID=1293975 RepID=A0AA88X167_9ASTE|nr:hypothetical protein RJ639_033366 [Escallonia herrerae]
MARTASSSKRKSSSKKKLSKISSSKAGRKKTSRRIKSKKLRRRDDSASYSYDELTSSQSVSSSSEDDYKSRKSQSRRRSIVKSSRKKVRRSSSKREDSPHGKKGKGSKRSRDPVKKKRQKKKPRRDSSVSSMSTDSWSCSTCRAESTSSGESESERPRGRSRENKKYNRDPRKALSEARKEENRSRSCSSCSRTGDSSDDLGEEKVASDISSRRLKFVITVVKQPHDKNENEVHENEHNEEIVYNNDDYPSCRSNDSNDGVSKNEIVHHSYGGSEKRKRLENVVREESFVSSLSKGKPMIGREDGSIQYDGLSAPSDGFGRIIEHESDVSATVAGPGGEDLELILRQKALENLRRFRVESQTNAQAPADQKIKIDNNVKNSISEKDEIVQNKLTEQDVSNVVGQTQLEDKEGKPTLPGDSFLVKHFASAKDEIVPNTSSEQDGSSEVGQTQLSDEKGKPALWRDYIPPVRTEVKNPDGRFVRTESRAAKQTVSYLPDATTVSGNPNEKGHIALTADIEYELNAGNTSAAETSRTLVDISSDARGSAASKPFSCIKSAEEHSPREGQGEGKGSSQFEQKTITRIRDGELVQASYKVYIPKRAPALARRKLQR